MYVDSAAKKQKTLAQLGKGFTIDPRKGPLKRTDERVAIIGLGYVGLPLAVCLANKFAEVTGLDASPDRVRDLRRGFDATHEVGASKLAESGLTVTGNSAAIRNANFYIVAVPTPITDAHQPDFNPLLAACHSIGPYIDPDDIVVFESTVYPGVTEDICGKLLAKLSGLKPGTDFHLGYSPERINPGDKTNTIEKITKVISGDSPEALDRIASLYESIIDAGVYRAPSIKVAEGAKVLENTQRDLNIALMNELALICDKVGIATNDVIDAAATKWNFIPFKPGLVGGHCIGVDPYYLASLADQIGHHPQVILAGRRVNDNMVGHVAQTAMRMLIKRGGDVQKARIGVYGITFKENVPDVRNSKAVELVHALEDFGLHPEVHDLHCTSRDAATLGIELTDPIDDEDLDLLILATPHDEYTDDPALMARLAPGGIMMDVRGAYRHAAKPKGTVYWSL